MTWSNLKYFLGVEGWRESRKEVSEEFLDCKLHSGFWNNADLYLRAECQN